MGLYDREPNFEEQFKPGDRMVLTGLQYVGTVNTKHGPAEKVFIDVVTRETYPNSSGRVVRYSALGVGFAALAKRATRGDFPHVAEFVRVPLPGGKEVKRFAPVEITPAEWVKGDDGPPLPIEALGAGDANVTATDAGPTDDVGF